MSESFLDWKRALGNLESSAKQRSFLYIYYHETLTTNVFCAVSEGCHVGADLIELFTKGPSILAGVMVDPAKRICIIPSIEARSWVRATSSFARDESPWSIEHTLGGNLSQSSPYISAMQINCIKLSVFF